VRDWVLLGALWVGKCALPTLCRFDAAREDELLRAIEDYKGRPETLYALRLAPQVFLRPGELRQAKWTEIAPR
jgi:hypothetical protein